MAFDPMVKLVEKKRQLTAMLDDPETDALEEEVIRQMPDVDIAITMAKATTPAGLLAALSWAAYELKTFGFQTNDRTIGAEVILSLITCGNDILKRMSA